MSGETDAFAEAAVRADRAAAASDPVGGPAIVGEDGGTEGGCIEKAEDILGNIRALKEKQSELRAQRKAVSKQLRNQSKRVSRIRKRARLLSDGDLVALLKMRQESSKDDTPSTSS